ncbi:MAG: excinuclease ABC subunit A [Candidatus Taylorbacteria bacterium RIFCSPLOWO2_01_FULL_44_26]|uniref:UvrABC system protein A n=2 Tax=Candidatus Tayloriibacteriota TaxID=1817919 RepID=A0A1G2MJK4_9BACT|nr:MAG: excinuclease ABC subunit A [Candidatus Taylorbacteria bacterium RIFCSPHIGHO2_02_FULL_44_12]OHA31314.1 MAG: excinuclease ABC subunit A [Candidatus Taylorbacteria bacterium RIFCSPLOWO2_01_FULL_44_26]
MSESGMIIVKGARTHNLRNITVTMPRNAMIAITGISGSGKSSLAFDTIFAEGQRRYMESLSAYARQFLHKMQKPDVDEIVGLSPAISIDQKSRSNNPRSTVATITEIYDYLRVLFARVGKPHCLICDRPIHRLTKEEILETVVGNVKAHTAKTKNVYGVDITSATVRIYAPVVVGRKGEYYQLLYDLLGKGYDRVRIDGVAHRLRQRIVIDKNKKHDIDVLVDEIFVSEFQDQKSSANALERLSESLEKAIQDADGLIRIEYPGQEKIVSVKFMCPYDGFSYPEIEPRLFSFNSPYGACPACNGLGTAEFMDDKPCMVCKGNRLRPEALRVLIDGKNIVEVVGLSIECAKEYISDIKLTETEREIAKTVLKEISSRLIFMINVGIEYLTLDRRAHTLSGGEAQRIRLASQLGSGLVGALYVLDEPTIGLHQRDNDRLIKTLIRLRDLGNTIIVVEHDEDTMFASDFLVDIGPGAGVHGGRVVVSGYVEDLLTAKKNTSGSLTLAYLRGEKTIGTPHLRRQPKGKIIIKNASVFNIHDINIDIPLETLNVITGVSGSGKSSLMYEIIYRNLAARFEMRHRANEPINCKSFTGTEYLGRAILIDQSPIGRTPRSNSVTYTGAWTHIRDLFAAEPESRARGWGPGRFSFNRTGGRCENCEGNGEIAVEMHFLPTVYVTCDVCNGKRFTKETLDIRYRRKTIHDILEMTIEEGVKFFTDIPAVSDRLETLADVGLGYVKLGQSATTLSGGEAQRVKISSELYRAHIQKTIYLLDEPTVGLHYEDVKKLIDILQKLVEKGNTVVVIEHNLDLIKNADYVIDIGPEGGEKGGKIVAKGTPEEVANNAKSYTGKYLKKTLKK